MLYDVDYDPRDDYDPSDDAPSGYCEYCGKPCTGVTVDEGIGPYEYGSIRGMHHDYHVVSDCCEEGFSENPIPGLTSVEEGKCTGCGKFATGKPLNPKASDADMEWISPCCGKKIVEPSETDDLGDDDTIEIADQL